MAKMRNILATLGVAALCAFAPVMGAHAETVAMTVDNTTVIEEAEEITFDFGEEFVAGDLVEEPAAEVAESSDDEVIVSNNNEEEVVVSNNNEEEEVVVSNDNDSNSVIAAAPAAAEVAVSNDNDSDNDEVSDDVVENTEVSTTDAGAYTNEASEVITGELIGYANCGYSVLSDGSDAYCVNEDLEHIDDNAQYEKTEADGSAYTSVFVEIAKADENSLNNDDTRSIAQLAIWAILNPDNTKKYQKTAEYYFGEAGSELFTKMVGNTVEDGWTVKTWGYSPLNMTTTGLRYQTLISGKATKNQPEEPTEPVTPVTPVEPEEPEEPVVPEEPVTPVTPVTPEEPVVPETHEEVTEEPAAPAVAVAPIRTPEALSWTSVPQTGDVNVTAYAVICFFAFVGLLVFAAKKNN